jgi:hypothetical protein
VRVFALVRLPVAVEWVRLRGHASFPLARLGLFRAELHACFTRRADALFKLGDALLCAQAVPRCSAISAWRVSQASPSGPYIGATGSLRASRSSVSAITW